MSSPDLEERKRMACRMIESFTDVDDFGDELYRFCLDLSYIEDWPDDYYAELRDAAQQEV